MATLWATGQTLRADVSVGLDRLVSLSVEPIHDRVHGGVEGHVECQPAALGPVEPEDSFDRTVAVDAEPGEVCERIGFS
jgi:hypothetical protein